MTTFYFECLEKNLYKGLDKFAQFFIAPLMKKESMTREREAVDSGMCEEICCIHNLLGNILAKTS